MKAILLGRISAPIVDPPIFAACIATLILSAVIIVFIKKQDRQSFAWQLGACLLAWIAILWAAQAVFSSYRLFVNSTILGIICLGFGTGYGLYGRHGPSRMIGLGSQLAVSFGVYTGTYFLARLINSIVLENHRGLWISDTSYPIIAITAALAWLLFSSPLYWKQPRLTKTQTRLAQGQCPACSYDLRGTTPGNPCPECGEKIDWNKVVLKSKT